MNPSRRQSVRARLTLWSVAIVGLILTLFGVGIRVAVQAVLTSAIDSRLRDRLDHFRAPNPAPPDAGDDLENAGPPPAADVLNAPSDDRSPFPDPEPQRRRPRRRRQPPRDPNPIVAFETNGDLRLGPPGTQSLAPDGILRAAREEHDVFDEATDDGQQSMRVMSRLHIDPSGHREVIQAAIPDGELHLAISGVTWALLLLIPGALVLTALGGAVMADRALQPVARLADAAARIQATHLSERLPGEGEDEFGRLTTVLNQALSRLEEAFERQKRFAADASHELRTPLATIKVNSSLALDEDGELSPSEIRSALQSIDSAADRAERLVRDLLFLARVGMLPIRWEIIAVDTLVADTARLIQEASPEPRAPVSLRVLSSDPTLLGDRDHLRRLLTNLIENARRYTPINGSIIVTIRDQGSDRLMISVADNGAGIAPEHLKRLGEAFYRADAARDRQSGGAGLGLAICKGIAASLGGTLEIESALGVGTTVSIILPRRPAIGIDT